MTNPIHPLFGQELDVYGGTTRGGSFETGVMHPDGNRMLIPAWATDIQNNIVLNNHNNKIIFSIAYLVKVTERLDMLATKVSNSAKFCKEANNAEKERVERMPLTSESLSGATVCNANSRSCEKDFTTSNKHPGVSS